MESGDQDIAPVQKALRDDPPIPLIDITRPDDVDVSFTVTEGGLRANPSQV